MTYLGLFLLSAATLAFEVVLTRIFSVGQFYHFAFMVVSLALLGFGASGALLTMFPSLSTRNPRRALVALGWGYAAAAVCSYLLTQVLPFDSFRIAHDWRQGLVLAIHYVALATPFLCSGAAVGLALAAGPRRTSRTYAANLTGSATGCLLAVAAPLLVGGEGTVFLSAALGLVAAVCFGLQSSESDAHPAPRRRVMASLAAHVVLVVGLVLVAVWLPASLEVKLSPYKSLSYALLYPDVETVTRRWNGYSRVDVVRSSSIRSLPGSGFRCSDQPPSQMGLTVDGNDLSPISHVSQGFDLLPFTDCLLTALPYRLRPGAEALVLEPRGGFDVLVALSEGARAVTVAEPNRLIVDAIRSAGAWAGNLYDGGKVSLVIDEGRAYARQAGGEFDVIVLSLTEPQRPVTSGAYSLAEDYRYTVQAFGDYLARLDEGGILVVSRWLQVPPSEAIRAFALAVEAVEQVDGDPKASIVALRSYQQMMIMVRRGPFTSEELDDIRGFAAPRAFDLVYLPDLRPDEVNRFNVLPSPDYHDACTGLLEAEDRDAWYRAYPFRVDPPSDDRPFFGHFFKWRQARDVLAMAGHVWQPFGGAGYFVLLALLALALLAAAGLIVLPLVLRGRSGLGNGPLGTALAYFGLLGLGYMFVEIPLLQRFILFLGNPAYAVATVLFAMLFFSGLGSLLSRRLPWLVLLVLPPLVVGYAVGLPALARVALAAPTGGRLLFAVATLALPGLLMGVPFPKGLSLLGGHAPGLIPWAWGVNGAISVVASVLAALLAFDLGFSAVMLMGAACYVGAWLTARVLRRTVA